MTKRILRIQAVRRQEVDVDKYVSALLLLIRELEADGGLPQEPENRDPAA